MSNVSVSPRPFLTIGRRVSLSFLAILLLFGLDLLIDTWSNADRRASVEQLRMAIDRQLLIGGIQQNLSDAQREIALLSQAVADLSGGLNSGELATFQEELKKIRKQISSLYPLTEARARYRVESLSRDFEELASSWSTVYRNFGVNNVKAVFELSTRGEPFSQKLLGQTLPDLLNTEKKKVESASSNFYAVGRIADRITLFCFLLSGIFATVVAVSLTKHITGGLRRLGEGAAEIGKGHLNNRITLSSGDELGELASTFNHMSEQLSAAHFQLTEANLNLEARHREVEQERHISESLLLNILPAQIADELRIHQYVQPKHFNDVTILFTDFVAFSAFTKSLPAEKLVEALHDYFTAFDEITTRYGLEKLKTIGDSYMCVSGLPAQNSTHPVDSVRAAFEMIEAVREREITGAGWQIRIGIHTGSVIAGVVGIKKFAFDIWGEAVNLSSRMESCGEPNRVNVSSETYSRIKDHFDCEHRGKVTTKDKTAHDMYFVNALLSREKYDSQLKEIDGSLRTV